MKSKPTTDLGETLRKLNLTTMVEHYEELAKDAASKQLSHVEYLGRLADIESQARYERSVARRIKRAAFPVVKSLDQFRWSWPSLDSHATRGS
jgi:DNA replication protein DnaC